MARARGDADAGWTSASTVHPPPFVAGVEAWFHHNAARVRSVLHVLHDVSAWVEVELALIAHQHGLQPDWVYANGSTATTARYVTDYADVDGLDGVVSLYDVAVAPFELSEADLRWLYGNVSHRLMRLYNTQSAVTSVGAPSATRFTVQDRTLIAILPSVLSVGIESLLRDMNLQRAWTVGEDLMAMTIVRVPAKS